MDLSGDAAMTVVLQRACLQLNRAAGDQIGAEACRLRAQVGVGGKAYAKQMHPLSTLEPERGVVIDPLDNGRVYCVRRRVCQDGPCLKVSARGFGVARAGGRGDNGG